MKHLFTYRFDGHDYSLVLEGESRDEAERRLRVLYLARYDGVLAFTIQAGRWFRPFADLIIWWKNLAGSKR